MPSLISGGSTGGGAAPPTANFNIVADQAEMLARSEGLGQRVYRADLNTTFQQSKTPVTDALSWEQVTDEETISQVANAAARLALPSIPKQVAAQADDRSVWMQVTTPATAATSWLLLGYLSSGVTLSSSTVTWSSSALTWSAN